MDPFSSLSPRPTRPLPKTTFLKDLRTGFKTVSKPTFKGLFGRRPSEDANTLADHQQPEPPLRVTPSKRKETDSLLLESESKWRRGPGGRMLSPHAWRSPSSPSPRPATHVVSFDVPNSPGGMSSIIEEGGERDGWGTSLQRQLDGVHVSTPRAPRAASSIAPNVASSVPDTTPVRHLREGYLAALLDARRVPELEEQLDRALEENRKLKAELAASALRHQQQVTDAVANVRAAADKELSELNDEALDAIAGLQCNLEGVNATVDRAHATVDRLRAERNAYKIECQEWKEKHEFEAAQAEHLNSRRNWYAEECRRLTDLYESSSDSPSAPVPSFSTSPSQLPCSAPCSSTTAASSTVISPSSESSKEPADTSEDPSSSSSGLIGTACSDTTFDFQGIEYCAAPIDFIPRMALLSGTEGTKMRYATMVVCRDCLIAEEDACLVEKPYVNLFQHIVHRHTKAVHAEHFLHRKDCPLPVYQG